ncbi:alpha/beta fold hydrolase [Fulvivirgaceae bacterium BMA12]|uniref:Alpha/beta fold hydrolase n=1 Tax=Agaribacillus aureus TaxID=3051825 RepID=A0ABT8L0R6_9BACT|nr:alpha/beta fold hydrolase [Fulvivirgaceae bacterium BMA12]
MPIIAQSSYKRPFYLFSKHLETIIPSVFRKIHGIQYHRERIDTEDGDFLDLDWLKGGNSQLAIISHGLEGSSERHYVKGMAKTYHQNGWDVLAWNCRTCSGEINRTARFYHHGATDDLKAVIDHAVLPDNYQNVVLVGCSMGGSLILKYLGENQVLPKALLCATVFSVPCNLKSSAMALEKAENRFYKRRFLKKLEKKVKAKAEIMPGVVKYDGFDDIKNFTDFDNKYTAPLHGFLDAEDFYKNASAENYLSKINLPTLLVNAKNDPFLPAACYPVEIARNHDSIYLEMPEHGGHVGFSLRGEEFNWAEKRSWSFVNEILSKSRSNDNIEPA